MEKPVPKKTIVIGASPNPERYAHMAVKSLQRHGHPVIALGLREGNIGETTIQTNRPILSDIDTISVYVSEKNFDNWIDYILQLQPKRVIFNPGTENEKAEKTFQNNGIQTERACTLVLLNLSIY